jgi:cell division protein FtsL
MARSYDTADAIGFAVQRDIRNRPLREVDRAGQRRMWGSTVIVLIFLALVLVSAWLRVEQIHLGYQIEQLQAERAVVESERRHLWVELESLRSPGRIEKLATGQLQLIEPTAADAFVIERVRTDAKPSSAVIARR